MNKIKNTLMKYLAAFLLVISFTACEETFRLDTLEDPNALAPEQSDIDFFLNSIQVGLANFLEGSNSDNFDGASDFGQQVTRMMQMFGPTYLNAYNPSSFNEVWEDAYRDLLIDIRTMKPLAEEAELYTHQAITQIVEAYVAITLVDYFGDVPFDEASNPEIFNPSPQPGEEVYAAAEELLNSAIENLEKDESRLPQTDLYYQGNEDHWIRLANTLKLKIYLQTREVDDQAANKIQNLINEDRLISSAEHDFYFQWSQTLSNPDSRHPKFVDSFLPGVRPPYQSNWYMNLLLNGQEVPDPRIRYYFYRQVLSYDEATDQEKPCLLVPKPGHYAADQVYCLIGNSGYWGRDHGDDDGLPPDLAFLTLYGVYPVGGPFDDNSAQVLSEDITAGLAGAGITPIMMSSYVDFMLAEAALTLGTGDARNYLVSGMNKSIERVMDFGSTVADPDFEPSSTQIEAYKEDVLADYDADSQEDKLEVIVKQFFIALYGNGVEAYNTYRRTDLPADLQPTLLRDPGPFMVTFQYPGRAADFNQNITQKPANDPVPVFWDANPVENEW